MVTRIITQALAGTKKSVLLLGPRQVGKSTLISSLDPDLSINLADEVEFLTHSAQPEELNKIIQLNSAQTIFIDEVQRLPRILNTVQSLIDRNKKLKFYLTGSSARKLKRGGANLLPGRVLNYNLGPLVASELNYQIDTVKALSLGTLPEAYLSQSENEASHLLKSYAANYLKEEIKAEALTRNLESFARFFNEAILCSSKFIDLTKIAKAAKVSRHAVPRYFEILEDTLIGYRVYPFEALKKSEDLIRHPKFYLFDNGVYNGIIKNFIPSIDRVGVLAEQLIFTQILHSSWAKNSEVKISSFRTRKGNEVDLILEIDNEKPIAIEVKTSEHITTEDCEGLSYFKSVYSKNNGLYIFHMGNFEKKLGPIWSLPWQKGIKEIGL